MEKTRHISKISSFLSINRNMAKSYFLESCRRNYEKNPYLKKSINLILKKQISSAYLTHREIQIDAKNSLLRRYYTKKESKRRKEVIWRFYQFSITKPKIYSIKYVRIYSRYYYLKRKHREDMMEHLLKEIPDTELHKLDVDYLEKYIKNKKTIFTEIKEGNHSLLKDDHFPFSSDSKNFSFGVSISQILEKSGEIIPDSFVFLGQDDHNTMHTVNRETFCGNKFRNNNHLKRIEFKKSYHIGIKNKIPVKNDSTNKNMNTKNNIVKNIHHKLQQVKTEREKMKISGLKRSILPMNINNTYTTAKIDNKNAPKRQLDGLLNRKAKIDLTKDNAFLMNKKHAGKSQKQSSILDSYKTRKQTDNSKNQLFKHSMHKKVSSSVRPHKLLKSYTKLKTRSTFTDSRISSAIKSHKDVDTDGAVSKDSLKKNKITKNASIINEYDDIDMKPKKENDNRRVRSYSVLDKKYSIRSLKITK